MPNQANPAKFAYCTGENPRANKTAAVAPKNCWVCFGTGKNLCATHEAEARENCANFNISLDEALSQLREVVISDEMDRAYEGNRAE